MREIAAYATLVGGGRKRRPVSKKGWPEKEVVSRTKPFPDVYLEVKRDFKKRTGGRLNSQNWGVGGTFLLPSERKPSPKWGEENLV